MEKKKIKVVLDEIVTLYDYHTNSKIKFNGHVFALEHFWNIDGIQNTVSVLVEDLDEIRKIFTEYEFIKIETYEESGQKVFKITL